MVFRSMRAAGAFPECGESARALGVRPETDIPVIDGRVEPGAGGLSVAPAPERLPRHRRPPEFGGIGLDPVWQLDESSLPMELVLRPDPLNPLGHAFIEPARIMRYTELREALEGTQALWRRI